VRALLERACADAAARHVSDDWGAPGPLLDLRLLDVVLRGRLAASCAALATACGDALAKADSSDAAARRDAAAAVAPCEAALGALIHVLSAAENGGAVWALCPRASDAFVQCCAVAPLVHIVETQRLTYMLARSLQDAPAKRPDAFELSAPLPGDEDAGPPTKAELLGAIRFVAEHDGPGPITRAVCETPQGLDCILNASSDGGTAAEHALALLALFGESARPSACRALTLKRAEVRSKLCGDGDPAPASAAARALLKPETREVTCASVATVARRLRILARTTADGGALSLEADDALVTTCCTAAACLARDVGELEREEAFDVLSFGREPLDAEAALKVAVCGLAALSARIKARRIVAAQTGDTDALRSLVGAAIERRLLSPTDASGVFRVLAACAARVCLLRGDVPPPLLGDVSDQVNAAANRVSALGVDGAEEEEDEVEVNVRPVCSEEGFDALTRCLDAGSAACDLADVLLGSIRCAEAWRDEENVLDVLLRCIGSLCVTFGPLLHERAGDDGVEDEAEAGPVETPLYLRAKDLAEGLLMLLQKYWFPAKATGGWSPSVLCEAVVRCARSSPACWLGCAAALERCLPRRAPCLPHLAEDLTDGDDGGFVGYSLGARDSNVGDEDDALTLRAAAKRAALHACLDGRRGARTFARRAAEASSRKERSIWDASVSEDVISFAVRCLESAAKALQAIGAELVAGLIDLGPLTGTKTAAYLVLEVKAAVACGKAKDPAAYALRAETAHEKRAAAFGSLEHFEAWHRAARLLTGVRAACCASSGRTALFACGAPLVLVDALALPKPEVLRLSLDCLAALTHDAQERTASDDADKSRCSLDALLAGYPPPECGDRKGSGISATFLAAFARALAKVLAKYHKADAHVHCGAARCLAILARERRNAPRILRALGATSSSSGGASLLTRALAGLATSLEALREGGPEHAPSVPEADATEDFKAKTLRERRAIYEELAVRAAKLLRATSWLARAPVALAWDARCDPLDVAALLKNDVAEALSTAAGLFAEGHEDAWSVLEQDHAGDASDILKAYAKVAKRAASDLIDASQATTTGEPIEEEDEALARQSDGDVAKRCREAAEFIVSEVDRQRATLQRWHADLTCAAKADDDDEPPGMLGGDRAHALGRHQGLGGLTRAGQGIGERFAWDGEDASRPLLRLSAKNVPLAHVRKAVAAAVGESEANALASDEAIRVSGLSQGGWGSRKRGRLALGKVRAAAAAAPEPAAPADPRARRSAPASGFSLDPTAPPPAAPADPRARKRRAKVVEAAPPAAEEEASGFSPAVDPRAARDPRRKRRKG